mmetsp:Transcript_4596/g.9562  ORF Transcript_4596/g.9562 Transcript_4596/m.9562 type:complete len:279 (-) Transcript_4596:444-1280(-)
MALEHPVLGPFELKVPENEKFVLPCSDNKRVVMGKHRLDDCGGVASLAFHWQVEVTRDTVVVFMLIFLLLFLLIVMVVASSALLALGHGSLGRPHLGGQVVATRHYVLPRVGPLATVDHGVVGLPLGLQGAVVRVPYVHFVRAAAHQVLVIGREARLYRPPLVPLELPRRLVVNRQRPPERDTAVVAARAEHRPLIVPHDGVRSKPVGLGEGLGSAKRRNGEGVLLHYVDHGHEAVLVLLLQQPPRGCLLPRLLLVISLHRLLMQEEMSLLRHLTQLV